MISEVGVKNPNSRNLYSGERNRGNLCQVLTPRDFLVGREKNLMTLVKDGKADFI